VERRLFAGLVVVGLAACAVQYGPPVRSHDARFGFLGGAGPPPDEATLCRDWPKAVSGRDPSALSHVSFADAAPEAACYTRVVHQGRTVLVGRVPEGCEGPDDAGREAMRRLADRLESSASPTLFPCDLTATQERAAARHDAAVLRRVAAREGQYPYAAVIVPGYGEASQGDTSVADWLPGDECHDLAPGEAESLGVMLERTLRASDSLAAGVAPLAIVSGGAVHSRAVEAFEMLYLLQCVPGRVAENVIVEPCAQHTHTNLRDAGRWLVAMGGRVAYLVTDEGLQASYFQDYSGFELIGGSIDQRSLRDWGYVIGSWRQASVGTSAGFWFTPYRFWADPEARSLTCVNRGR